MASRFWVGGAGTWDNSTTTHWSATTGGAGGASVPGSADTVTFDGSSGGGTVTVDTTINGLSFQSITCGAFTGTLAFNTNNPSITLTGGGSQFNISGAGTRTINLGSGTFTFSNVASNQSFWDATTTTGLTLSAASSTFVVTFSGAVGGTTTFAGGSQAYGTLNVGSRSVATPIQISGSNSFVALNLTAPLITLFPTTTTITNAIAWNGSTSSLFQFRSSTTGTPATLNVAVGSVISWASLTTLTFSGTTVPATNSFDNLSNTGVTITQPTGGVVGVIGS